MSSFLENVVGFLLSFDVVLRRGKGLSLEYIKEGEGIDIINTHEGREIGSEKMDSCEGGRERETERKGVKTEDVSGSRGEGTPRDVDKLALAGPL
ncbi:hypothetical protein TIFTF001_004920 [Ficus carica]|uniref:Uncharacterized protein n=1 Tax=Ficus carica TaxID=3494 RepID=A0AA88CTX0_FICCA|nr:hypothetical protein TIFTF001_004920 [Ficus carica]